MIRSKRTRSLIPSIAVLIMAGGIVAFVTKSQGVNMFLFGLTVGILLLVGADMLFLSRKITASQVANRLHELAQNGVDDVLVSGVDIDMDNFIILHLTGGWRIGFIWLNGRAGSVINAMCNGVPGEDFRNQPMAILQSKWPDDMQKLQDIIAAALKRDGSI